VVHAGAAIDRPRDRVCVEQVALDALDRQIVHTAVIVPRVHQHAHILARGQQVSHKARADMTGRAGDQSLAARDRRNSALRGVHGAQRDHAGPRL
jgi:hypothetical protein